MKKILIICGPTATGKTKLAANLAKKFSGELISSDSRQVYEGMDIVTGKDRPKGVKIYGYDLVKPDQDFSVAHFIKYARALINQISLQGKLPILVGGTGLYLNSLINPPQTLTVPPDWFLRRKLEQFSARKLLKILKKLNPQKVAQMNHSDQLNPRRLIRAIEVAQSFSLQVPNLQADFDVFWLGLTADKTTLAERIETRVKQRLKAGAIREWQRLKKKYRPDLPSMSANGYRQLPDVKKWIQAEQQYARRQLTWFKKNSHIHWFDVTKAIQFPVVNLVKAWYTKK